MFGKDYDKEILELNKRINDIIGRMNKHMETQNNNDDTILEMIKGIQKEMIGIQETFLEVVKVQDSHKKAIMLLSKR